MFPEHVPSTTDALHEDPGARQPKRRLARDWGAGAGTWLVNAMLPPRCPLCRTGTARAEALCPTCWRGLALMAPPVCARLGIPLPFDPGPDGISAVAAANPPPYERARAVAQFSGPMRQLVHHLKYGDREDVTVLLAGLFLTPMTAPLVQGADVIVPVPLAWRRLVWRRFNQASHLAVHLGHVTDKPVSTEALKRRRWTVSQVGLTLRQRQENVAGAFVVSAKGRTQIKGLRVLLVDDVITTGSTVAAAARALIRAGASAVDVVALAMVTDARRVEP